MRKGGVALALKATLVASLLSTVAACAPEVGSKRWCAVMRDKPRGDWTANQALDFARHCVLAGGDEK
jgi:hypothetical protein